MSLWSDITSAIGSVFGGGGNNSSNNNNPYKKQQQQQQQNNTPVINQRVNLPVSTNAPTGGIQIKAPAPVVNIQPLDVNQSGLVAHPIAPTPAPGAQPQPQAPQAPPSIIHQVGSLLGGLVHSTIGQMGNTDPLASRASPFNRGGPNDSQLLSDAAKSGQQNLQTVGSTPYRVVGSIKGQSITPSSDLGITIAGDKPVPTYQQIAKKSGGLTAGVQAAEDALMAYGGIKGASDVTVKGVKALDTAASNTATRAGLSPQAGFAKIPGEGAPEIHIDTSPSNADLPLESPESGIKPVEKPTNAPTGETVEPTTTPNTPESGVKPVAPPPATTIPIQAQLPLNEPAPVAPEAVPAPVAAEQAAAQNAVDKTAQTIPKPVPPPEAAAPAVAPAQAAEEALAAKQAPVQQVVANEAKAPTKLEKTGYAGTDLENAAQAVHDRIENAPDFAGNRGNGAQSLVDELNGRGQGHDVVSKELSDRLDSVLTKEQQANVQEALQTGTVDKLTGDEKVVAQILQQHLENPADVFRTAQDENYVSNPNHSAQIRQGSISSAAKTARNMGGSIRNKISNFNDLLQRQRSVFSDANTGGKFTSGTDVKYGDASDLGLVAKKDGTFVDKSGKVYNHTTVSNKELTDNSNVKLHGLSTSSKIYAKDTMSLADRTAASNELINNPEKYGLSKPTGAPDESIVSIKGPDGKIQDFATDKGTQKVLQESGIVRGGVGNKTNLATTLWNKATTGIVQSIVMNPTVHSMNQLVQGMTASGLRANGLTGLSFLKDSLNHSVDDVVAFHDAGGYVPSYGKNVQTVLSKLTYGGSKINEKTMSAIDGNFRVGAFKSLVKGGMDPKEATATVNRFMGDRSVFKDAQPQMGMFMHYFVTMNKSAGSTLAQAVKGHPGALTNAAIAAGATYGLQQAWQKFTGNQNASVHAPGMIGIGKDYIKGAEGLAQGQFRNAANPILNRVNPLVAQGAEQILGVNNYGDKFKNGASRAQNLASMTPETNAIDSNGHSLAEKAGNTFGLYEPHIKGDMAANPNSPASFLNVKGAQDGSTVAFPKDFTGEQSSKAINDSGLKYSSKTAAQFNTQSQTQQQAITKSAADLKSVGITNPQQIFEAAKLSPSEITSYKQAVTQLNQAGKSTGSKDIQEQLLANGNKDLAGKLNTGAPGATYDAQRALDRTNFEKSGQQSQSIDGLHFEKTSNPNSPQVMEQKDFDYKTANDQITSAKNSGSVSSYQNGNQNLLDNIGWQLNHADLTPSQRDTLVQKAVQTQEDYAKIAYQGNNFKAPKGVSYQTPQINGDHIYTPDQLKAYGLQQGDGYVKQIQTAGAKYGVDINALLSIAAQEGLGGGVGDNGTSFGPFQLHVGGALPAGKDQAWAESPAGIDYAVKTIKGIIGNKTGADAIQAIATDFEKSTDPQGEAARALALYSGGSMTLSPGGNSLTAASGTGGSGSASSKFKALGIPSSNGILMPKAATGLTAGTVKYKAPTLKAYTASTAKNGNPFVRTISSSAGVK